MAMIVVNSGPAPLPSNKKIKYYYKLTEKQDLDDFINSIFAGKYQLQPLAIPTMDNNATKAVVGPVLTSDSAIAIDGEIEEGLYLIRIRVYNTTTNSLTVQPSFNNPPDFKYTIPANGNWIIYDIFTKEEGNSYYIILPSGLALLEVALDRVFEKGNRINIPPMIQSPGYGTISFRLRKGTYAIKIPYNYNNSSSNNYTNLQIGTISSSLGASVPLVVSSIPANGSGSGQFIVYLKISGDYEDISINLFYYGEANSISITFGLEIEEINEFVQSTNFLSKSITLSGSQVVQNILNVKGSGTHLRLKYASVSGLSTTVTQCQLQAANLNRNSNYSVIWDFIAGGSGTPPGWSVDEINAVQLVANGGTSAASVNLSLILLYEVIAGELS